ncbi:uncharacterized protein METZ01_LOCUS127526, partial [marine metagenome]
MLFLLQGCSTIKGLFGKRKSISDPNDPEFL